MIKKTDSVNNTLSIKNIHKEYSNGIKALNGINLELNNGMFGLLGPNGAGKSSLMRTIATMQSPDGGEIVFNNKDIISEPIAIRPYLGYLPQEFGVYPNTSAIDLLNYLAVLKGLLCKSERMKQIEQLLEITNLTHVKNKAVANFSGGMKQRFGIAQALLGKPKVLIVDEPTAGLDPEERNRFHNILNQVAKDMVVILSTHIVGDIHNLCPQMAIVQSGEIKYSGSPEQLLDSVTGKVWSVNIDIDKVSHVSDQHFILSERLISGQYQVRVYADSQPNSEYKMVQPDLEDAYFYILNHQNKDTYKGSSAKARGVK